MADIFEKAREEYTSYCFYERTYLFLQCFSRPVSNKPVNYYLMYILYNILFLILIYVVHCCNASAIYLMQCLDFSEVSTHCSHKCYSSNN